MKKANVSKLMMILAYILLLIPFVSLQMYSLFTEKYSIILVILILVLIFSKGVLKINYNKIIMVFILLLLGVYILKTNGSGLGMLLQIIWPLALLYLFSDLPFNKNYSRLFFLISLIFLIIFYYTAFSYGSVELYLTEYTDEKLNPNTTGLLIACLTLLIKFFGEYGYRKRKIQYVLYLTSAIAIYYCGSRMAFVGFIVCVIFAEFAKKLTQHKKLLKTVIILIFIIGLFIPIFYIGLYKSGLYNEYEILGKQLFTGRQYIWMNFFEYIQKNMPFSLFIGSGYREDFYVLGRFNLHNTFLTIFAEFGIFGLLIYGAFILKYIDKIFDRERNGSINSHQWNLFLILLLYLFCGLTETTLNFLQLLFPLGIAFGLMNNRDVILTEDVNNTEKT